MSGEQESHLRLSEVEDLVHHNTKKIKDGASEVMGVKVNASHGDQGSVLGNNAKVSYKDKVMEIDSNFDL
ncbi:Hsp70 family protein [Sesbania bispinosa]|nr:Hsp70 family protein [Sesbania bispinosa]